MSADEDSFREDKFKDEEMSTSEGDSYEDDVGDVAIDNNSNADSSGPSDSVWMGSHSSYFHFLDKLSDLNKQFKEARKSGDMQEIFRLTILKEKLDKQAEADSSDLDSDTKSELNEIDDPSVPSPTVSQISTASSLNLTTLQTPPPIPNTPIFDFHGSQAFHGLNAQLYLKARSKTLNYCLLLTYELTLVELITYFPMAYVWSGFLPRANAVGGSAATAKLMLWSRGLDVEPQLKHKCENLRSSLAHQLKKNLARLAGTAIGTSAATWIYTGSYSPNFIADSQLLHITNSVVHHPQGEDRGLLSIVVEHALANGHWHVMLSQVEEYARHFRLGPVAPLAANADQLAMVRFTRIYNTAHP